MQNLRGIIFMLLAMAGFAVEDSFIKVLSGSFPVSQILIIIGFGGCFLFTGLAVCLGHRLLAQKFFPGHSSSAFFRHFFGSVLYLGHCNDPAVYRKHHSAGAADCCDDGRGSVSGSKSWLAAMVGDRHRVCGRRHCGSTWP